MPMIDVNGTVDSSPASLDEMDRRESVITRAAGEGSSGNRPAASTRPQGRQQRGQPGPAPIRKPCAAN